MKQHQLVALLVVLLSSLVSREFMLYFTAAGFSLNGIAKRDGETCVSHS